MLSKGLAQRKSAYNYHLFRQPDSGLKERYHDHKLLHVLMIDDSSRDIELVKEMLGEECSLHVDFSFYKNPIEALKDIESDYINPDLVILDLVMPSINGAMVLKRLRGMVKTRNIPIIIHSSKDNYETIQMANKLQAHAFFSKPLNGELFERFVLNQL